MSDKTVEPKTFGSIYDLAKQTGVSASTVSRVLNQRGRIGQATRLKVLATARTAGFRPRMTARPTTIGVVIDRHRYTTFGGFVSCMLSHLVQALSGQDVAVEMFTEQNLSRIQDRLVDGVLALAWDDGTIELLRRLKDVPVVTLNRMDLTDFSAVATDHRADGALAVDYFAQHGHQRMTIITEEPGHWGANERVAGFMARHHELGLPESDVSVAYTQHQPMYGLLRRLLVVKPTALFVAGEHMALEATYILKDMLGVKIPQELSLIGMESAQVSPFLSPPLTAITQPLEELASKALDLLLSQINNGTCGGQRILLKNQLIERESVATLVTPA